MKFYNVTRYKTEDLQAYIDMAATMVPEQFKTLGMPVTIFRETKKIQNKRFFATSSTSEGRKSYVGVRSWRNNHIQRLLDPRMLNDNPLEALVSSSDGVDGWMTAPSEMCFQVLHEMYYRLCGRQPMDEKIWKRTDLPPLRYRLSGVVKTPQEARTFEESVRRKRRYDEMRSKTYAASTAISKVLDTLRESGADFASNGLLDMNELELLTCMDKLVQGSNALINIRRKGV